MHFQFPTPSGNPKNGRRSRSGTFQPLKHVSTKAGSGRQRRRQSETTATTCSMMSQEADLGWANLASGELSSSTAFSPPPSPPPKARKVQFNLHRTKYYAAAEGEETETDAILYYSATELQQLRHQAIQDTTRLLLLDQQRRKRTTPNRKMPAPIQTTLTNVHQACCDAAQSRNTTEDEIPIFDKWTQAQALRHLYQETNDSILPTSQSAVTEEEEEIMTLVGLENLLLHPPSSSKNHQTNSRPRHLTAWSGSTTLAESRRRSMLWAHCKLSREKCGPYCQRVSLPGRLWAHTIAQALAASLRNHENMEEEHEAL